MSLSPRHLALRPRALAAALAFAFGLGGAICAQAQSLQDLYQTAHGYDASYLAARASLDAAQYRYDKARGKRLQHDG